MKKNGFRGPALIEKIIAYMTTDFNIDCIDDKDAVGEIIHLSDDAKINPIPMLSSKLSKLCFAGGHELPPSLIRWLAFDNKLASIINSPLKFGELMTQEFGLDQDWSLYEKLLAGYCYLLPGGSDSRRFLYVGLPDKLNEYPVVNVDVDEEPYICIYSPGFDVWLLEALGLLKARDCATDMFDHPLYGKATRQHARRLNLNRFEEFDAYDK